MNSRFARSLNPFLDTSPMVGDVGKAATDVDTPVSAMPAKPGPPNWKLDDITSLVRNERTDNILLRASNVLLGVEEGITLHDQLLRHVVGKKVQIRVEAFLFADEFKARCRDLSDIVQQVASNGVTDPFRDPVTKLYVLDKGNRPIGFNVILLLPDFKRETTDIRTADQAVLFSDPFRLLKMSTTLFHELLHVFQIYTKVDFTTEISQPPDVQVITTVNSGHTATTFDIALDTLKLEVDFGIENDGEVLPNFQARIESYMDQVIKKYDILREVTKVRAAFGQPSSRQPPAPR